MDRFADRKDRAGQAVGLGGREAGPSVRQRGSAGQGQGSAGRHLAGSPRASDAHRPADRGVDQRRHPRPGWWQTSPPSGRRARRRGRTDGRPNGRYGALRPGRRGEPRRAEHRDRTRARQPHRRVALRRFLPRATPGPPASGGVAGDGGRGRGGRGGVSRRTPGLSQGGGVDQTVLRGGSRTGRRCSTSRSWPRPRPDG